MNQNIEQGAIKKGNRKRWLFVMVTAIALVAVVLTVQLSMRFIPSTPFLGDKEKVLLALGNTMDDSKEVVELFQKTSKLIHADSYTISMESAQGIENNHLTWMHTADGKQIQYVLHRNNALHGEITAWIGKEQVKLHYSNLPSSVFIYDYRQENNGYIFSELLKPTDVKAFNEGLDKIYKIGLKKAEDIAASTGGASTFHLTDYVSAYQELEFEKADTRSYKIDGNRVSCQGYETVITKEFVEKLSDNQSLFKEDAKVTFYIDNTMVAAILIKTKDTKTELRFLGGNYRMQNLEIREAGEVLLKLSIDDVKAKEDFVSLKADAWMNEDVIKEKLSFDAWQSFLWADIEGEPTLESDWKDLTLSVKRGATLEPFSGKELNIGTASLWELGFSLIEIIMQSIMAN